MEQVDELGRKLDLVLKVLSLSRVALAHRLGVDKSLVGRWLSGAVHPTEYNLTRLSALAGEATPGLRLADWYLDLSAFAARIGVDPPNESEAVSAIPMPALLREFLDSARGELNYRGGAYEGFWRTTRPSLLAGEKIFHEYGMLRRTSEGLIEVTMGGSGLDFRGWAFPNNGNLFAFLYDSTGRSPVFALFRVPLGE